MMPVLIFLGVPSVVAVGSGTNQIIASSISGVIAHWRRGNVDFKIGGVLLTGVVVGSGIGVLLFRLLRASEQIDVAIRMAYVVFLAAIGGLMLAESVISLVRPPGAGGGTPREAERFAWAAKLSWPMSFPRSGLCISILLPLGVGCVVGVLTAILGLGSFVMVPAMIYLLGMPTQVVVGTSLFQIIFLTMVTTFLQAGINHNVDIILTSLLMLGGIVGAQWRARGGAWARGTCVSFWRCWSWGCVSAWSMIWRRPRPRPFPSPWRGRRWRDWDPCCSRYCCCSRWAGTAPPPRVR